MAGITLIQDLAVVLLAAGIAGLICKRIGLSVVVGYLIAGMAIGPHTAGFSLITEVARIETLSQIGLVFLMFAIGLGLSLSKLRQMGLATLIATGLGALIILNLTKLLGLTLDWSSTQSLFIAAMFMVSSSAVIAKIVADLNLRHERAAQLALSITVLEDVVAVLMLAILASHSPNAEGAADVGGMLAILSSFVVVLVMIALYLVPLLLRRLEAKADPELQTITVAGLLFLMALLAVKAGYSLALGAFLLGAIVAEIPQKKGVEQAFTGMRDMFSSVFFVSIGMVIDVRLLIEAWPWILALGGFTLIVRAIGTGTALMLVGMTPREAKRAALMLTPVGEFTFLIAQLGVSVKILEPKYYPIAIGVSMLTVLVTPLTNRYADRIMDVLDRVEPRWLKRGQDAFHAWIKQLSHVQGGLWWQMGKGRLIQIGLEVLFVTGLLVFSERIFVALEASDFSVGLSPWMLKLAFWSVVALLTLIPLVAIWRKVSTLAKLFAELASQHSRLSTRFVENALKIGSALLLAHWLSLIVPTQSLSRWALVVITAVIAGVLAIFSRRLVYWHNEWQTSLHDVLEQKGVPVAARPKWVNDSGEWDINVQECELPERAACSGQTIAEINVRARFGCSITQINRHGHAISAPEPNHVLYAGDRLLLLGTNEQVEAARNALLVTAKEGTSTAFDETRLETVTVPSGPRTGATMAQLQIPKHTGVLVAGHHRHGVRTINPSPNEILEEGDELLVLGAPGQIRLFKRWLAGAVSGADVSGASNLASR